MGLYLRKAFKTGPLRFNLSLGGVGVSAGVTGARLGLNSRGVYVHGGRHGLYYRKQLSSRSRKQSRRGLSRADYHEHTDEFTSLGEAPGTLSARQQGEHEGTVSLFKDTGTTFTSDLSDGARTAGTPADTASTSSGRLPGTTALNPRNSAVSKHGEPDMNPPVITGIPYWMGSGVLVVLWFVLSGTAAWLTAGLLAGVQLHALMQIVARRRAFSWFKKVVAEVEQGRPLPSPGIRLPRRWSDWLNLHIQATLAEMAVRDENIHTVELLTALDALYPVEEGKKRQLRTQIVTRILDEMLEDHMLSEQEELTATAMINALQLTRQAEPEMVYYPEIMPQAERIAYHRQVRETAARPLEPISVDIPLVRGEEAFDEFTPVRLLNERVLDRYQREGVRYRVIGYEIELEGRLILTDRRLLLVETSSREFRLNQLGDVTADPEAGVVELNFLNRKSPVILTSPQPVLLAARIEKVLTHAKQTG